MNKLSFLATALALSCLVFAAPAPAEMRWYVGGSIGLSSADIDDPSEDDLADLADIFESEFGDATISAFSTDTDDTSFGWKLFGGLKANDFFAVEVFYVDFGKFSQEFEADIILSIDEVLAEGTVSANADFESQSFGAALVASYPVTDQIDLFAKVGFHRWSADLKLRAGFDGIIEGEPLAVSEQEKDDDDGTDFMFGVGASYGLTDAVRVRLEWERFKVDAFDSGSDVDLLSAGIEYRF